MSDVLRAEPPEPPGHRRAGTRPIAWAAVFLAGALVRVLAAYPVVRRPFESDVTLTGLTAFEILRGDLQIFLLNGVRNGALESYLHAAAFLLFGASRSTLYLAPLLAAVLLLPVYALFARELLGRREALAAAFFLAFPSPVVLELSDLPFGYVEMLLFTAVALWLACRVARLGPAPWSALGFGAAVGIAWWCSAMSVMGTLPAALWIALRRPGLLRNARFLALAVAGCVLGALPWITFNVRYPLLSFRNDLAGWQSNFAFRPVGGAGQALDNADRLASEHLPTLLVKPLCAGPPLLADLRWLAGAFYVLALVAACAGVATRSSWGSAGPGGERKIPPCLLPLLIVVLGCALFTFSAAGSIPGDTSRYLFPIGLAVPLLLAWSWSRLHGWKPAVAWTMAALLTACNLAGYNLTGRQCREGGRRLAEAEDRLLGVLASQRIDYVFGGYWDVYALNFHSHERIKAIPDLDWADYHGYQKALGTSPARLALVGRKPGSVQALAARAGLQGRVESIDGLFEVFLPAPNPPPGTDPQQLVRQLREALQPAPLPVEACRSRIEVVGGAPAGALRIPRGGRESLRLRVVHRGKDLPWVSALDLPGPNRAVRVGIQWFRDGAPLFDLRAELPRTLAPGEEVELDLPLEPRTPQGEPLPPGLYTVRIGLLQELVHWFEAIGDGALELRVEVTGTGRFTF